MMEGSLSKWTNVMKGWQYRWFVLDENAGLLSYYTSLLKSCMKEFVSTIENKNTDTNTNKSKTVAWQMVAQRFNELNGRERDITEIKQQWRTMKLDAKKNMSTLKISMKCTGGGPKPPSPSAETMEILSMIPQEFEKDFNVYDSDGIATKKGELESQESQEFVLTPVALENIEDVEENVTPLPPKIIKPKTIFKPSGTKRRLPLNDAKENAHRRTHLSKEKMTRGVRRGCVRLRAAIIGIDDEDDSTFTITVDHKTFHFQARDGSERERWVRALEDTILRHGRRERWSRSVPAPRHRHGDLERRISEADAYLQIIIDLVSKMNTRVTELADPLEKSKGQIILDHSNAMLDNIKHSIVLLQIAKNTVNPVNGVYQGPTNVSQTHIKQGADISPNVEMGAECRELSTPTHSIQPLEDIDAPRQAMSLLVPDTSYSSSEGEDDFYDADDEPADTQPPGPSASRNCTAEGAPEQDSGQPAVDLPRTRDGEIDYDALYEDESDSDLGSMENHGSVVTHLLSQVKIGMDLTKVVLPTFILERRSLLEMYADSFAHPDQFVKIVDMATPRERMVQVVRWYLSSYHAGRKSQVAKKPYNPILGEVFRCYWDLDGAEGSTNAEKQEVGDGPVPWCSPDQLSFVAEQVSHHPPISAFYAEHVNKKIQFEAWLWTKSKFLGLSIGVHNIGKGIVTLLDTGEEYTLTFPNGYGRSILTVPWIELGGSVCIECQQTGHKANIEFLTKPFYGGKKHRVTCEVFAGLDKKPYYTAQGEWNSRMDGRWTDTGRTEAVFEVSNMKARRKRVAPIVRQSGHESRRVWRHVTCALRAADCDAATNAKRDVEQHQRDAVKIRHANGDKWITQLFSPKGEDAWEYNSPLRKRLESKNNTTPQHKSTENADNTR